MIRIVATFCFLFVSGFSYANSIAEPFDLCTSTIQGHQICLTNYIVEKQRTQELKVQFFGERDTVKIAIDQIVLNTHEPELYFSGSSTIYKDGQAVVRSVFIIVTYFPQLGIEDSRGGDITITENGSTILSEAVTFVPIR